MQNRSKTHHSRSPSKLSGGTQLKMASPEDELVQESSRLLMIKQSEFFITKPVFDHKQNIDLN